MNPSHIPPIAARPVVVGLGEVLWDLLPGGPLLGGAPANFTHHSGALGAEAHLVSRVGNDDLGREIIRRLAGSGVHTGSIEIDPAAPTGTVSVELGADGQPHFTIHENVAWDRITGQETARRTVARADAVCFGTLAQRHATSRSAIQSLVGSSPAAALRILDVNLRQNFFTRDLIEQSLLLSNVLKVNETELPKLAELFGVAGDDPAQMIWFAERFRLSVVACTRGGKGSLLLAGERWSDHPGIPTKVVDTIGAGDSFTAAMTLGLLAGWDLDVINERANRIAAYVAACPGGTPKLPDELLQLFSGICSPSSLSTR